MEITMLLLMAIINMATSRAPRSTEDAIESLGDFIDANPWIQKFMDDDMKGYFGAEWKNGLQMRSDGSGPIPSESTVPDDVLANASDYKLQYISVWQWTFGPSDKEARWRANKDGPFIQGIMPVLRAIQLLGKMNPKLHDLGNAAEYIEAWTNQLQHNVVMCTFMGPDGKELIVRVERRGDGIYVTRCRFHDILKGEEGKDWRSDWARSHGARMVTGHEHCDAKEGLTLADVLTLADAQATPERKYNIFNRNCTQFAVDFHNDVADDHMRHSLD